MKKLRIGMCCIFALAGITSLFYSCQSSSQGGAVVSTRQEQVFGYLYDDDGSPAVGARVSLIPANTIPAASLSKAANPIESMAEVTVADGVTDKNGRYSFSFVPAGIYNIFGEGNGTVSYAPSVTITSDNSSPKVLKDTLKLPGSIKGMVTTHPPMDSRRIFILIIGGYFIRWPDDSVGHFTINGLAKGSYKVRFLCSDSDIPVLDTMVTVVSGKETDLGTIILSKEKIEPITTLLGNYRALKFGLLVHFNMSTFDRCCCAECYTVAGEWGKGSANAPAHLFRPSAVNCGQWADAAKTAGAKYMLLTVKHHDGFCLWNSTVTEYDVANSSWAQGTGDLVREFSDSTRTRGLQVGFHYSIRDLSNGISMNFIKTQLTELLSNYGPISCIFFEGWGWDAGYKRVPYAEISSLVKALQPNCLIIENNHEFTTDHTEIVEWEMPIDGPPPPNNILPGEGCEPIRYSTMGKGPTWFWHPDYECDLMSPQMIVDRLNLCKSNNANYLLNVGPDTTGQLPRCLVECLESVGTLRGVR